MDDLPDSLVHKVAAGDRSSVSVEHAVFLYPVHHEIPQKGTYYADRLEGDEEAIEHEDIADVDVLVAHFKLDSLVDAIMVLLVLGYFAG